MGFQQAEAFEMLKELITRAETLAYFKNNCKTRIVGDAGPTGLGAVLLQQQHGMWRVVTYASRNFTDVERRYSQTEKEALALVWACEMFDLYVFGHEFELETDHKPLEHIYGGKQNIAARIERWVLRLQGYQHNVVYRPGKVNIADCLSRLNQKSPKDLAGAKEYFVSLIAQEHTPVAQELEVESEKDPKLKTVR